MIVTNILWFVINYIQFYMISDPNLDKKKKENRLFYREKKKLD